MSNNIDRRYLSNQFHSSNFSVTSNTIQMDNPIGMLQEHCVKHNLSTPVYNNVSASGPPHMRQFTVCCTVNTHECQATASTKKLAKHLAAEKMWHFINNQDASTSDHGTVQLREPLEIENLRSNLQSLQIQSLRNADLQKCPSNPIGAVQELCVSRGLPTPKYKEEFVKGAPHMPNFTISCTIQQMKVQASRSTKKEAKSAAAQEMWLHLVGGPVVTETVASTIPVTPNEGAHTDKETTKTQFSCVKNEPMEEEAVTSLHSATACSSSLNIKPEEELKPLYDIIHDRISRSKNEWKSFGQAHNIKTEPMETNPVHIQSNSANATHSNIILNPTDTILKVQSYIMNSVSPKIIELLGISINQVEFDYVQFLEDFCKEESFVVKFMDVRHKSEDEKYRCFAQVNMISCIVCLGVGYDQQDARQDAAKNALEFFKLMSIS